MNLMSSAASLLPDAAFVGAIARTYRRFEPELPRVVASFPKGENALDVGTWYGPWTYYLAKRAGHVTSFEPNTAVADVLERTVPSNVTVLRMAASNEDGSATLTLPEGGRGTEGRATLQGLADGGRTATVPTRRLDDLDLGEVSLIKIDVEGHETKVLEGAVALVEASWPVLVVEIEERHGGIAPPVSLLREWGYRGQVLVEKRWTPLDDFDLVAHQREHLEQAEMGYLESVVRGRRRYINNIVFTHPLTRWNVV
jgi:FkbM family methyltransferase